MSKTSPALAFSKVNLFLDIVGKREDGYHDIVTVFAPLKQPVDKVSIQSLPSAGLEMDCPHAAVPTDAENLCIKAARSFASKTGCQPRWRILLEKNIPVAAGLGGGSSDAAAVLRILNKMLDCPVSTDELHEIAAGLGADVPFFLSSTASIGKGKGDRLSPVALPEIPLLLINPGFPVSASWAYQNYSRCPRPPAPPVETLLDSLASADIENISQFCYNVFDYALFDKFPLLEIICEFLCSHGCFCAHISGSGPTIFGIGAEPFLLEVERKVIAEFGDHLWTQVTHTLPRLNNVQY